MPLGSLKVFPKAYQLTLPAGGYLPVPEAVSGVVGSFEVQVLIAVVRITQAALAPFGEKSRIETNKQLNSCKKSPEMDITCCQSISSFHGYQNIFLTLKSFNTK